MEKIKKSQERYLQEGYTKNQIDCLMEGITKGVDVSACENPDFFTFQINQIVRGLIAGVDVSLYAKTEYNWFQMEEIRKGLECSLDVTKYLDPQMDFKIMREIRKGLEVEMDMTPYLYLGADKMRQLRKAKQENIDLLEIIEMGFDAQQLEEIRYALEKGIDVLPYITTEYRGRAIREITIGLEEGMDVSIYAKNYYSWRQMQEIRLGQEHRVDVTKYMHRLYSDGQMQEIRLGLENGVNVDEYKSFVNTANDMRQKRQKLEANVTVKKDETTTENADYFKKAKKLSDLEVILEENGMEAYVDLTSKVFDWDKMSILKTLYMKGVRKGILMEQVEALAGGSVSGKKLLIAKGEAPVNGADGYYEYFFRTDISKADKDYSNQALDYQGMEWFEMVAKGQKLAEYHLAAEGIPGYDVSGRELLAPKGREMPILKGRGFVTDANQTVYYAAHQGKVTYSDQGLWIAEIYTIDSVVSLHGKLYYDGMVVVKGNMGSGASISASDDILIEGYVEDATLTSGGNILIRQGVNASGEGKIDAKKAVFGKYFEDAHVHAGTLVHADYCMNCDIVTEGKVVMAGENGSLIGGSCKAQEGVYVKHAGNKAGKATYISIGIGEELYAAWQKANDDIAKVKIDLERLKVAQQELTEKYPPELRNTMDVFLKIGSAVFTKNQQLQGMNEKLAMIQQRMTQVRYSGVTVLEELYENVTVEIDGNRWESEFEHNVTLKCLNKRISVYRH